MDPALITPLTEITDYLLKCKPGIVSILNIVRISQYYGFETFNENKRLTIAGKIILIDIDYLLPEEIIEKISISLAIDLQNVNYNFMKSFDTLLYNNLKESTLYKFNNNFKKLSILDKFSSLKFDLFNYLNNEINKLSNVELNLNDNLGYYLQIHQDFKYLNQQLNEITDKNKYYLEINIKETPDTMIKDLKCGICLELVGYDERCNGLVIPELVLIKLGIIHYDIFQVESIPTQFENFKFLTLIGSNLINLKQFFLEDLSNLDKIVPVLQNWYLINNLILRKLVESNNDNNNSRNTIQNLSEKETDIGHDDMSIDDYLALDKPNNNNNSNININNNNNNNRLIELILLENHHLQIKIGHLEFMVKDCQVSSETNLIIAEKLNKVEDLTRVLELVL